MGTPAFISADSDMISEGNFLNLTDIGSTECKNATAGAVYKETNVASQCFSNTGTGVCNGGCTAGFAEAADCLIGGGSTFAFSTVTPLIAAGDNPSCPASPPTPIPTLPPQPTSAPAPQTALIPCGNPGAPADCDDQGNNNQGNNNQGQDDNNPGTGPITSTSNEGTGPIYDANNGDSGSGGGGSGAVSTCSMGLSHVVLLVGSLLCKMMMA